MSEHRRTVGTTLTPRRSGSARCHTPQPSDRATAQNSIDGSPITIDVTMCGDISRIEIAGELDLAGADQVFQQCTGDQTRDVVVDLSDLTFMDCGGYRALVASRAELALHHRTLALVGAVGEPRRLLELVQQIDTSRPSS